MAIIPVKGKMQEKCKNLKCLLLNEIAFAWSHRLGVFSSKFSFLSPEWAGKSGGFAREIIAVDNRKAWRIRCCHRAYSALPPSPAGFIHDSRLAQSAQKPSPRPQREALMKHLMARTVMARTAFVVCLLSTKSHAQSGAIIPQTDAGQASPASCVILKRMGRIDRATSRLPSLGITGKRFRYVEGKPPEEFSLHRKMTDHDVRNLQAKGAQVLLLDSHYSSEDLQEARANCLGQSGKTLTQAEGKAPPATARGSIAGNSTPTPMTHTPNAPAPQTLAEKTLAAEALTTKASKTQATPETTASKTPTPEASAPKTPAPDRPIPKTSVSNSNDTASSSDTTVAALVDVSSTPAGADVYIDEHSFGRTPATTIILTPGNHKVVIKKNGFIVWKKKFNLPSGHTNVDAALVPRAK